MAVPAPSHPVSRPRDPDRLSAICRHDPRTWRAAVELLCELRQAIRPANHPGSELFVVYNEEREQQRTGVLPGAAHRSFIVKVNRLFRF
ncbi:MAG: hypothetical protein AB7K63_06715 [Vicinamibacterales bacterium]